MKKQRRNGFTLIELLAVIIILGIVALIATPIVINVVENAQKKAFERSAQGYYDAARYVHNDMMLNEEEQNVMFIFENGQQRSDNEKYTLKVQGEVPNKGLVYLSKSGEVLVSIANDKWCAKTNGSGTIELTDDPNDCGYAPEECLLYYDSKVVDDVSSSYLLDMLEKEIWAYDVVQLVDRFDTENPSCKGIVVIPEEHDGKKVEGILSQAFSDNKNITSVILSKEIKYIGADAFAGSSVQSILFNENLRYIDDNAFLITQLSNVKFPSTSKLSFIGAYAFAGNELTTLDIPNSVTVLGEKAFSSNNIDNLTIGMTLNNATILFNVFSGNPLTNLTIKEGVTEITTQAFSGHKIVNLNLPSTLTKIGAGAFANNQLTSVTIPDGVISIEGDSIHSGAFSSNKLQSLILPNSLEKIGDWAFSNNKLTNVIIPNSVTYLSGFNGNQLTNVTIPSSVTAIGENAFDSNQLTEINIPNTVIDIGNGAFSNNQLASVEIPSSVINIAGRKTYPAGAILSWGAFDRNQFENASSITILGDDPNRFDSTWESIGFPAK